MRRPALILVVAVGLSLPTLLDAQREVPTVYFRAASIDVTVRFANDSLARLGPEMRRVLTGALDRYTTLFGGPPRSLTGGRGDTLLVTVSSDPFGGGSSDPGVLRILVGPRPAFGFYDWRFTVLHEAFHLWNAESFRYASGAEQWFNEGVSEFYAFQTAARLGLIDIFEAIRDAAIAIGFYTSSLDQDKLSLAEAGASKGLHYFLVYYGGWVAALVLDRDLRGRTAGTNARSLDDLLHWMYENFDRTAKLYTTGDVARGIRATTGQDYTEFFARHITGKTPLPVATTLNLGDLARLIQARMAAIPAPAPDSLLMLSLGVPGGPPRR